MQRSFARWLIRHEQCRDNKWQGVVRLKKGCIMDHKFDAVAKALATGHSRRDALRWLSGIVGSALMGHPLTGQGQSPTQGCRSFCNTNTNPGTQHANCMSECTKCRGNINQLCGQPGSFVCCTSRGQFCSGPGGVCLQQRQVSCDCAPSIGAEATCFPSTCVTSSECADANTRQTICAQLCSTECGPTPFVVTLVSSCEFGPCS